MQQSSNRGGARTGAGRKPRYEGGRKLLTISCAEKQKEQLKKLAEEKGVTLSEYILDKALN